ncbi:MAG TPA: aminotransferase class I/II-fold pyridoxal phosphate-dependent enzyme, partial [Anaerolineae bacterium]|nr:aminotransferase class I/II-fold pyridoxal phosphate-dependent enzyme [Anaerolineae bacterium]
MSQDKLQFVRDDIESLKERGLYINIRTIESPQEARVTVDGKRVLNFCSNNYLGLANHPKMKNAAKKAIDEFGVGPGAVRSIAGTMSIHLKLERRLAEFKQVEGAVSFQS